MSESRHAVLHGLIDLLPPSPQSWTAERRELFLRAFEASLDLAVPTYTPLAKLDAAVLSSQPVVEVTLPRGRCVTYTPYYSMEELSRMAKDIEASRQPTPKTVQPSTATAEVAAAYEGDANLRAEHIVQDTCRAFEADPNELRGRSTTKSLNDARKACALLLVDDLGWSQRLVSQYLNRHETLLVGWLKRAREWEKFDRASYDRLVMVRKALASRVAA